MPRGRQYYDPIVQVSKPVETSDDLSRIELVPTGLETGDGGEISKWVGRRIGSEGAILEVSPGDFDHDRALAQAKELWPGLEVFELRSESEDSTWDGTGPSPRLWQAAPLEASAPILEAVPKVEQVQLRIFPVTEVGTYVLLEDIRALLNMWAAQYEEDKNPSAALALREAMDALREVQ